MGAATAPSASGCFMPKRASLVGTVLRARPLEEKIDAHPALRHRGAAAVLDGRLRPVIDRRYRLDNIADAHAYMETNANVGKILLDVAR